MACVIHTKNKGVFLGAVAGLAFWSKLEHLEMPDAQTFPDEAAARQFVGSWLPEAQAEESIEFAEVEADVDDRASAEACVKAGLDPWEPKSVKITTPRPRTGMH